MARRHVNEFLKTTMGNTGRIAGMGIVEDRYDDNGDYYNQYSGEPKFYQPKGGEDGEVIVMKASEVLKND